MNDGNIKAGTPISAILKQEGITTKERKRIIIDKLANELRTSIFFNKSSIVNYFGSQRALGHYNYIVKDYFGGLPAKMLSTISLQIAGALNLVITKNVIISLTLILIDFIIPYLNTTWIFMELLPY